MLGHAKFGFNGEIFFWYLHPFFLNPCDGVAITLKILNGIGGQVIPYFKGLLRLVITVEFDVSIAIHVDLPAS